jgi:hypothetical protein
MPRNVLVSLSRDAGVQALAPATEVLMRWVPTRLRETDTTLVLPVGFTANIENGTTVLEVDTTGPDWAYHVTVTVPDSHGTWNRNDQSVSWSRYVQVPPGGEIQFHKLPQIDPKTLDPIVEPEAAWWEAVKHLKGDPGESAAITDATATTLPAGTNPTVTLGGTNMARTFRFGIPQGLPGVNAVPADDAVGAYIGTDGTKTRTALNAASVQAVVSTGYTPPNLFRTGDLSTFSFGASTLSEGPYFRSFVLPVKPGEVYSVSREATTNNRFRVAFTASAPAANVAFFGLVSGDTATKLEGIAVPAAATHMVIYLDNNAGVIPNIKVERGAKVTPYVPHRLDDDVSGVSLMARFPRLPGELDDTDRIKRAMDHCVAKGIQSFTTAGDPHFNKQYVVRQITIPHTLTSVDFASMPLKRPNLRAAPYNMTAEQAKWVMGLRVEYNGDTDMPLMTIKNVIWDGNARENWTTPGVATYEMEQASMIFVTAENTKAGKANVHLENIYTFDSVSDGIHVWRNANVTINNHRSNNCFRGGLSVTGGRCVVTGDNLIYEALPGTGQPDGVDVEIDTAGYGGTYASTIKLSNMVVDFDLDLTAKDGTVITLDNVTVRDNGYALEAGSGGTLTVSNSSLRVDKPLEYYARVRNGGDLTFNGCKFHGADDTVALKLHWYPLDASHAYAGQHAYATFNNCVFVEGREGLGFNGDKNTTLTLNNCEFRRGILGDALCKQTTNANLRANVNINNVKFDNAGRWIDHQPTSTADNATVRVTGINITNPANKGAQFYFSHVTWLNPVFEHGWQITVPTGGVPTYKGTRTSLIPLWKATTAYTMGARVITAGSDRVYEATTAGTTGTVEPGWVATGGTITDGTVVWTRI